MLTIIFILPYKYNFIEFVCKNTYSNKMGGQTSKQIEQQVYIHEEPERLSLKKQNLFLYFWVDPNIFNGDNQKTQNYLRQFINLEGKSSIEGLENQMTEIAQDQRIKVICAASLEDDDFRRLQSNDRVESVVLFCRNRERANLLLRNFSKIVSSEFDVESLKEYLLKQEQKEVNMSELNTMLFVTEDNVQSIMERRMNYRALICPHNREKAKQSYLTFLRQLFYYQQQQIDRFKREYNLDLSDDQRHKQVLDWCFQSELYWKPLQLIPEITMNPKVLAYLRLQFKDVHQAIRSNYKHQIGEVYVVITLNEAQRQKLSDNVGNFVAFSSFVKGYSSYKPAYTEFKKKTNGFLLRIMLPPLSQNSCIEAYDFGFYKMKQPQSSPDVIFNIFNLFYVDKFRSQHREAILYYGSLAKVAYCRKNRQPCFQSDYRAKDLMRNYDYWEDRAKSINNQATVLQVFGYRKQSVQMFEQKYENAHTLKTSQTALDKSAIQLGNAYKVNKQYNEAIDKYQQINPTSSYYFAALIHLAESYLKAEKKQPLQTIIENIQENLKKYKDNQQQIFTAQNYIGMELINKGKYKAASQLYDKLITNSRQYYNHKYEGIALVHEITRNMGYCQIKLKNYTPALQLLNNTKTWQLICEGKKSNLVVLTEDLIRYANDSKNNNILMDISVQYLTQYSLQSVYLASARHNSSRRNSYNRKQSIKQSNKQSKKQSIKQSINQSKKQSKKSSQLFPPPSMFMQSTIAIKESINE